MISGARRLVALMAAATTATSAMAQSAPAGDAAAQDAPNGDVVVTARPITQQDALRFARDASTATEGHLAKFIDPVCPRAFGFPAARAVEIEARMRRVAEAAGVTVAKAGCRGNAFVFAVQDGAAMLRDMRRLHHALIDSLSFRDVDRLIDGPGPVRAWNITEVRNETGDRPVAATINGANFRVLSVYTGSNIRSGSQQSMMWSVVVLDWPALYGKTTVQVADYALMRLLAKTNPVAAGGPVQSILALFDGSDGALSVTYADLAYLRALYKASGLTRDRAQVSQIADAIRRTAEPVSASDK